MKKEIYYIKDGVIKVGVISKKSTRKEISYGFMMGATTEKTIDTYILKDSNEVDVADTYTSKIEVINILIKRVEDSVEKMKKSVAGDLRTLADDLSPKKKCSCDDDCDDDW